MTYFYWIARISTVLISLFLLTWIFPAVLLPQKYAELYIDTLLGMRGNVDPSRFAAIPFVYLFLSVPAGFLILLVSEVIWYIVRNIGK